MIETATRSSLPLAAVAALAVLAVLPLFLSDWIVFLIALALAKGAVVLGAVMLLRSALAVFAEEFANHAPHWRAAPSQPRRIA